MRHDGRTVLVGALGAPAGTAGRYDADGSNREVADAHRR
jgi:hypothetical protein